ncbi:MAG: HEPN domain-containing protein [Nitrososphaerota archaeon]
MKFNPINEVRYRIKLAQFYLKDAEEAFKRNDWRTTVSSSQLCAENAARAVVSFFKIPSWSHDPSSELIDIVDKIPNGLEELINELVSIVRSLAPEHGRSTYGEPTRGLTPWDIYSITDAEKALRMARKALENH